MPLAAACGRRRLATQASYSGSAGAGAATGGADGTLDRDADGGSAGVGAVGDCARACAAGNAHSRAGTWERSIGFAGSGAGRSMTSTAETTSTPGYAV